MSSLCNLHVTRISFQFFLSILSYKYFSISLWLCLLIKPHDLHIYVFVIFDQVLFQQILIFPHVQRVFPPLMNKIYGLTNIVTLRQIYQDNECILSGGSKFPGVGSSADTHLILWDTVNMVKLLDVELPNCYLTSLSFNYNGSKVVCTDNSHVTRVIDLRSTSPVLQVRPICRFC